MELAASRASWLPGTNWSGSASHWSSLVSVQVKGSSGPAPGPLMSQRCKPALRTANQTTSRRSKPTAQTLLPPRTDGSRCSHEAGERQLSGSIRTSTPRAGSLASVVKKIGPSGCTAMFRMKRPRMPELPGKTRSQASSPPGSAAGAKRMTPCWNWLNQSASPARAIASTLPLQLKKPLESFSALASWFTLYHRPSS
jgi:hypothetical protein